MKKIIAAIVIALATSSANAVEQKTHCDYLYDLAEAIMISRQAGMPLSHAKKIMKTDMGKFLVLRAYEKPKYFSDELKQNEINSFAEKAFYTCEAVIED